MIADLDIEEPGFPVWPQNMPVVLAFLSICTQWRVMPMASGHVYWQGLDYAAVRAGLAQAAITLSPSQWNWLRVMESAASACLNGYRG